MILQRTESSKPKPKFINDPENCVREALEGVCCLNPDVRLLKKSNVLLLKNIDQQKVAVLCGGGSGHEPAHAGFVLNGMLSGAICGGVFASPSYKDVFEAIQACKTEKGILLVIKNYTGDVLNFELAANIARSRGIKIATLRVADDIALEKKQNARAIAGTVVIYKILGAAAASGMDLQKLVALGQSLDQSIYTLGISLSACALPGSPTMFQMNFDEMELGMGIHGEKGKERMKLLPADKVAALLIQHLVEKIKSDRVVLALNNLGGTTDIELMILMRAALRELYARKIKVVRVINGKFMSSLDMHGISITLLDLGAHHVDAQEDILKWLDLEVPGNKHFHVSKSNYEEAIVDFKSEEEKEDSPSFVEQQHSPAAIRFKEILQILFESLIPKEAYLNSVDAEVGDGDTGFGVSRSSKTVLAHLKYLPLDDDVPGSLKIMAELISDSFGGSSGPLYGFLLVNVSEALPKQKLCQLAPAHWAIAFKQGVDALKDLVHVQVGDRTMIDALDPAAHAAMDFLKSKQTPEEALEKIVKAAREGADKAKLLVARRGRSAYLGDRVIGLADPGCELAYLWLSALKNALFTISTKSTEENFIIF